MAEPLNLTGFVGLDPNMSEICTIEASCVTGFEPMAQEEIQVISPVNVRSLTYMSLKQCRI